MKTILPFPAISFSCDDDLRSVHGSGDVVPLSFVRFESSERSSALPEGESMSREIAASPRAQAMQDDIFRLIEAVRRRYGREPANGPGHRQA